MLRVAGVASMICNNLNKSVNEELIFSACLLHDIGNIVKERAELNYKLHPNYFNKEVEKEWRKIREEFIRNYGKDDYIATYKILNEIGVEENIFNLIKSIEFAKMSLVASGNNYEQKICLYSDARIAPEQATTLENRLSEVKDRYIKNKGVTEDFFENLSNGARAIEKQIFDHCKIRSEDITEEQVKPLTEVLRNFDIHTC